jgi:hypothetical protein
VEIPQLRPREWELLLDTAAAQAGHVAALLDRDMPEELAEDAARAGVRLLPRHGELAPNCSCPDWGHPCKHAAAVYYQVARLLDEDPFVLFLLRGKGEQELLDELQRRNAVEAVAAQSPAAALRGVPAREVFAAARDGVPPLPAPPPPADRPGPVAGFATAESAGDGLDPAALEFLAADAAARAARLLREALTLADAPGSRGPQPPAGAVPAQASPYSPAGPSRSAVPARPTTPAAGDVPAARVARVAPETTVAAVAAEAHVGRSGPARLTVDQDLVRLAAAGPPPAVLARLRDSGGHASQTLALAVRAWQGGGAEGLRLLNEAWDPEPGQLAAAREGIRRAWEGERAPALRTARNRLTVVGHDAQLRLGADGRWYPYRKEHGTWSPAGPADRDPAATLTALLAD